MQVLFDQILTRVHVYCLDYTENIAIAYTGMVVEIHLYMLIKEFHYENMSNQIYWKFHHQKLKFFR